MKKIGLLFATVIMMMLFTMSISVSATNIVDSGTCGKNLTWTLDDEGTLIISGTGAMDDYKNGTSPYKKENVKILIIENGVTKLCQNAFYGFENLTNVTIADSVIDLGTRTFSFCYNLENVYISKNITSLGIQTFYQCKNLTSMNLNEGLISVGDNCFGYCTNLSSINIPSSVTNIGDYAFARIYNLSSIVIPKNVASIGKGAFYKCSELESIIVDVENEFYASNEYGVLFNKDKTELIQYPIGSKREFFKIPESVTVIGDLAFSCCTNLTNIEFPANLTTIERKAFSYCDNLESATIPDSVTTIEEGAFTYCSNLTKVIILGNIAKFEGDTFSYCYKLSEVSLPDCLENLGTYTFFCCESLKYITIPVSVTSIGYMSFYKCTELTNITINKNITSIDNMAFDYCLNLTDIYFTGFEEEWNAIVINYNPSLSNATIHFNHKHTYKIKDYINPNHFSNGFVTYICECNDVLTETIAKIPHSYNAIVTEPTCDSKGYTTYTCECGDTYVADYVDADGHCFTNYISDGKATCTTDGLLIAKCDNCDATDTKPEKGTHKFSDSFIIDLDPTCTTEGQKSRHCLNCTEKTDITPIGKLAHTYNTITIDPTCTDRGHKIYTCLCGDSYTETLPALGHNFSGSACTECGYDKADSCTCNCHKTGLSALIWKILNFFYKLFRINETCACGTAHY